jgi:hypothetical protein
MPKRWNPTKEWGTMTEQQKRRYFDITVKNSSIEFVEAEFGAIDIDRLEELRKEVQDGK